MKQPPTCGAGFDRRLTALVMFALLISILTLIVGVQYTYIARSKRAKGKIWQ
jgi:hypothetical protein